MYNKSFMGADFLGRGGGGGSFRKWAVFRGVGGGQIFWGSFLGGSFPGAVFLPHCCHISIKLAVGIKEIQDKLHINLVT